MVALSFPISFSDGVKNEYRIFDTENSTCLFLMLPAMGIRASFYQTFAKQLSERGNTVCTMDWRGFGNSSIRPSRKQIFSYQHLLSDTETLILQLKEKYPQKKVYVVGHSLGGQMGMLLAAKNPKLIQGLILIASSLPFYKIWKGSNKWSFALAAHIFYPISKIWGYFPGHILGFAGKESQDVMKDWCYTARNGTYRVTGDRFDYEAALKNSVLAILAFSIDKDWLAPCYAVRHLYQKNHPDSSIIHHHITAQDIGVSTLNHFNWAKHPTYIISHITKWIDK